MTVRRRTAIALGAALLTSALASAETGGAFSFQNELPGIGLGIWNAGLLCLPVLAWNVAFTKRLDMSSFGGAVPAWYSACENVLRGATLAYPFARPMDAHDDLFKIGAWVYGAGLVVYFLSWLPLMDTDPRPWQKSLLIQLAPAYTPLVWLAGISFMANSPLELCLSLAFVGLHVGEYLIRWKPAEG